MLSANQNDAAMRLQSNPSQPTDADAPRRITRMNRSAPAFRRRRSSARLWEQLLEYFEVRFRTEKYGVPYFLAESEAKQSGPRKEAVGARARSGRGFKCTGYPQLLWAEAESLQNSQCKPVNNCGGSHDFPELQFQIWKSGSRPQKAQPACYEWI